MSDELRLFLEDTEEQLTFMENALVEMQENGVNEEDIGAIFRAMHTIKGTAGMFGFDEVVAFTHVAENLLSEVRSGTVKMSEDMIDLFLLTKDNTEALINTAVEEQDLSQDLKEKTDTLLARLKQLTPSDSDDVQVVQEQTPAQSTTTDVQDEVTWHIEVLLNEDFFTSGMDILNIISCLRDMGEMESQVLLVDKIPSLESYEPIKTYIGFEIILKTDESKDTIEEVFEFILDDLELNIFKKDDKDKLIKFINSKPDKDAFKELLIKEGLYTNEDFSQKVEAIEPQVAVKKDVISDAKVEQDQPSKTPKTTKKPENKHFSLRVNSSKVDQLINQISEMVIANAKISQQASKMDNTELEEATTIMSDMLEDVRSNVMNIRMVQVGDSFAKFKRIVGDTAKKIGKDINFVINGGETELDKMVVEKISDPIMHMLRNSVDHGVEMPDERVAVGKSPNGNVTLSAYPDAGTIVIEIRDDGKGLDKQRILEKAIANGLVSSTDTLTDKEIYNLIFAAGLSTAQNVTNISGRGVGMDVVKRNIEDLRGTVEIDSTPNKGSLFTIRLPLTLAIIDGFLIQAGETKYIIPLEMIQECIELNASYQEHMHGNEFINLRDSILPLLNVREYFKEGESQSDRDNIVVVRYGQYKMGLQVDELYGEFQTVIKPLGDVFENVAGISGGTILGSGEIALIFDIPKLMEQKIKETKN